MIDFVHLHVHSDFSLLDGLGKVKGLAQAAAEMDMPALALTDHGVMFGVLHFYHAAKKTGIKPIVGCEIYVSPRRMTQKEHNRDRKPTHLVLLAENQTGYHNLMQIATAAQLEGFYYKPRVDKEYLAAHAEGLIALSSCGSGEVPRLLQNNRPQRARQAAEWYRDVFGPQGFFLELQEHDIPEMEPVNKALVELSRETGIPLVATNDAHYTRRDQAHAHEVLLCIQTGKTMTDPSRMRMNNDSYYLKSAEEMAALFPKAPEAVRYEALRNTVSIAERCEVDLDPTGFHLPELEIPAGFTAETYLRRLTEQGLRRLYGGEFDTETIQNRMNYELRIIQEMEFDVYFLIVWDLCEFSKRRDIWWNVRGSAAGSIVAYGLGITNLDPLAHDLIFERFLNPGRVTMPDIDLDYPDDRRGEMIDYTMRKYGADKVAQIITFGTLGAKAAIRDVGRALDIPLGEVDKVARLVPGGPGVKLDAALGQVAELRQMYEGIDYVRSMIDTAREVEGVSRHASTHAAGVVVTDKPLVEYTPLHRPTRGADEGLPVVQYTMDVVEDAGLLKLDFLGLSTLTILRQAADLIEARHGLTFTQQNIPLDDPETYRLLSSGEVTGIFQVESGGMRRVLTSLRPTEFEHVVAVLALYRPGPMEFIDDYIAGLHGTKEPEYVHPALEPILGETFGICVYQEQIIRILTDIAGYTPGDADLVRKAVGKKIREALVKHRESFVQGAREHSGLDEAAAHQIFDAFEYFARYGFNKCLPGDTEVVDSATGRLQTLQDLYNGAAQIEQTVACDPQTLKLEPHRVASVLDNGVKPVFRLTTALRRQIEATGNHPFYTFDGWRRLEDLQAGDLIAVPRRLPVEGKVQWPDYQVIVLGHLLAEGNLCHPHSVYYYSRDTEQVADYVHAVEQFDNVVCSIGRYKGSYSVYAKRIRRNQEPGVVRWAKDLGIWGKNAREKEIPAAIFELNNRQVALLISRLWAGDGHLGRRESYVHAYYATASERLARQLQHLLLRLGVVARLRSVNFPYREGRIGYQVHVMGNEHIKSFAATVGQHFVDDHRRELSTHALNSDFDTARGTRDIIPLAVKQIVREEKANAGITWLQMREEAGISPKCFYPTSVASKRGFRRETIASLADYFESERLRRFADSDIYWDRVASIEYFGEKQTYDLTIAGVHNFIANDILVHNSHSANYATITVQTAYLKAHYPVEYMTALLTVEQGNTDKVGLLIAEARRMGIEVLPPNVNYSGMDFTIEDEPEGVQGPAIRYGLNAIKNVGEGPVEVILAARKQGGLFTDIDDFCQRVDLRQVNRRALECLIKAGALSDFGTRAQLLAVMDRMMSISQQAHGAAQQYTMFEMPAFAVTASLAADLPPVPDLSRKEVLAWEKDLIGAYVSEHPLSRVWADLEGTITALTGQIDETMAGRNVTMAGMVNYVRPILTKKGDPMAFAQIEDLQGTVELVIFPRTWEQTKELWEPERVLVVCGKVNLRGREPSILVDSVTNEITKVRLVDEPEPPLPLPPSPSARKGPVHIYVTVPRNDDLEQVIQRLGQVYDLLQRYPGDDPFSIHVENGSQGRVQIDFPNDTTGHCVELEQELRALLGGGTVRVEQIGKHRAGTA